MSKLRVSFLVKRAAVSILLVVSASVANAADINILPIGDSLTKGFVGSPVPNPHGQTGLATYRPYLVGTVSNYLNDATVNPNSATWNWLGNEGNTTLAAPPSPIALTDWDSGPNGPFRDNHEGIGGSPAKRWRATGGDNFATLHAQPHLSTSTGPCENVALIMLGTNDFPILGFSGGPDPLNGGAHSGNHQNPLNVIHSNGGTYDGYIPQLVNLLQSYDSNVDIFISAIPPVDKTTQFVFQSANNSWYWTEQDRETARLNDNGVEDGPDINGWISDLISEDMNNPGTFYDSRKLAGTGVTTSNGFETADGIKSSTDSNDLVATLNREIEDYVANTASGKVTFVNPLVGSGWELVDTNNDPKSVDGGQGFDLSDAVGNSDLADGLHLSYTGDQKYAAAFWEGVGTATALGHANLRTCVSTAALAVPEPSSFVFLGLVATLGFGVNRIRKQ